MASCHACELAQQRIHVVPGEGAEDAEIIFIGEAPGYNEDRLGRPFVGQAGAFLDELLALVGLSRETVYIANVIKCRPPGNRDPLPGEILACKPWLDRQFELIRPKVVVTLGRFRYLDSWRTRASARCMESRGTWVTSYVSRCIIPRQPCIRAA